MSGVRIEGVEVCAKFTEDAQGVLWYCVLPQGHDELCVLEPW